MSHAGSPVASPEDVACYEECITDEILIPQRNFSGSSIDETTRHNMSKATSGKVTKKGEE